MIPIARTVAEVREPVRLERGRGATIGLVPTMGALHAGHAELIRVARRQYNFVAVSVFVNPTQFGPNEDYSRYPRALPADVELSAAAGAGLVFAPTPAVMYPPGFTTYVVPERLQDVLCGASRPGHFRGVCTVVLKLFNIVQPDAAFFGQKDAQQVLILERMAADLDVPVRVVRVPTVREPDGLAMSSRNVYLTAEQRREAVALSQALSAAQTLYVGGERRAAALEQAMRSVISAVPDARIDYVRVVDAGTLTDVETLQGPALAALAVFFGSTRLIDNTILE